MCFEHLQNIFCCFSSIVHPTLLKLQRNLMRVPTLKVIETQYALTAREEERLQRPKWRQPWKAKCEQGTYSLLF